MENAGLKKDIVGVWWLESRTDVGADGELVADPTLGSDPLGILTYATERFAAQFMKRDRRGDAGIVDNAAGENNTGAIGGYDAYFGTYEVKSSGEVIHRLEGALTVENVGLEVSRNLSVDGDQLKIILDTTSVDDEPVTRTLTWQRIG